MKKIGIISLAAVLVIASAVVVGVVYLRKSNSHMVMSTIYEDEEYAEEIDSVELAEGLANAVPPEDQHKVKMAVLENNISSENEEKLIPVIEEYGTESTLIGYSYLNNELVTWDELRQFIEVVESEGVSDAIREYEEAAPEYTPSKFKRSQLEEWINVKGYPASDITTIDRLAQRYDASFDELMERYENGTSVGELKAEFGLVNTNSEVEYVTITEDDVRLLAEKCGIEESRAEEALAALVRLKFDTEKLGELNFSNEYELLDMVLEEKYGGEN